MGLFPAYPEEVDDLLMERKVANGIGKSAVEGAVAATEFCLPQCKHHLV